MENYDGTRFVTKVETFDNCIIDANNRQQEQNQRRREIIDTSSSSQKRNDETREVRETRKSREAIEDMSKDMTTLEANAMADMTLTPVRLPALLDGEFFSVVRVEDSNVTVRCLQCEKLLNGNLKSTGNFLSHIKRVHPFLLDKIKSKSNQRKPAIAYIDMTPEKTLEVVKSKRGYRKCYKPDDSQIVNSSNEDLTEQSQTWPDTPPSKRRATTKQEEQQASLPETPSEIQKLPQTTNTFVVEDEFDAVGRNVAAKLRNMRTDQRIVAEKLLNDVLFEAQLGTLHRASSLHV